MEDPPVANPERDVVGTLRRPVSDEVAGAELGFRQPAARLLLLVGVPGDKAAARPECHVDEPGAVDARGGHPAPFVTGAEHRARVLDGLVGDGPQPVWIGRAAEVLTPHPAEVRVLGLDTNPDGALLEHTQRLACQGLRHLLGIVRRPGAERRELACERVFA